MQTAHNTGGVKWSYYSAALPTQMEGSSSRQISFASLSQFHLLYSVNTILSLLC